MWILVLWGTGKGHDNVLVNEDEQGKGEMQDHVIIFIHVRLLKCASLNMIPLC